MSATHTRFEGDAGPSMAEMEAQLRSEGLSPSRWSNAPGAVYERHEHPYHKHLVCVSGSITFHTPEGDVELRPGDRLDLDAGIEHSATVGSQGVTCLEAATPRP